MNNPTSLHELLLRHQEGMAGATALSLLFGMNYAILKRLTLGRGAVGTITGGLVAGALWMFLAEYLNLAVYFVVPVGFGCGFAAYPLLNAWVKRDDGLAEDIVDETSGFFGRWLRKKGEKP